MHFEHFVAKAFIHIVNSDKVNNAPRICLETLIIESYTPADELILYIYT